METSDTNNCTWVEASFQLGEFHFVTRWAGMKFEVISAKLIAL